jgi:hypothetical protein
MKKVVDMLVKTPKKLKPLWQEGETRSLGNNPYKILPSLEMLMS